MKNDTYGWEDLFAPHILERGFDYYCDDQVGEITLQNDVLEASVFGTEVYKVVIRLRDGNPIKMDCSCPYAADGKLCKHMAAVLYQWEDECAEAEEIGGKPGSGSGTMKAEEEPAVMVSNADESLVRDFLTMVLTENESYRSRFRLLTGTVISSGQMRRYQRRVDQIVKDYMGRDGYIPYERAGDFASEVSLFLDKEVQTMVDCGYSEDAFTLTMYIFRMLPDLEIDDSGGELLILAKSCTEYLERAADSADEVLQVSLFDQCVEMLEEDELDFLEDSIEVLLTEAFHVPALLERKLEYTAEMCALFANPQQSGDSNYSAEVWTLRHLNLLEESGASDEKIEAFCREYWRTKAARQFMTDRYLNREDYAGAEQVLLESLETFGPQSRTERPYDMQLLDVYRKSGQQEKYTALLKEMVLSRYAGNMKLYLMLKAQYTSEEWKDILQEVLHAPAWGSYRDQVYQQEGMAEHLMKILLANGNIYMAQKYTDVLKGEYPGQLLDVYERELQRMSVCAAGRRAYQEWARILRKMKKIPGGEERVRKIIRGWQIRYSNRPAMMDELQRV